MLPPMECWPGAVPGTLSAKLWSGAKSDILMGKS